jgi:hypothetical protein
MSDELETAAAEDERTQTQPFWGHFKGEAMFPESDDCREVTGVPFQTTVECEGMMMPTGPTVYHGVHCATVDDNSVGGKATFTTAEGDAVRAAYMGSALTGPPLITVEVRWTITGGTGRFKGATGSVVGMAYVTFKGLETPEWPVEMVISGTITY